MHQRRDKELRRDAESIPGDDIVWRRVRSWMLRTVAEIDHIYQLFARQQVPPPESSGLSAVFTPPARQPYALTTIDFKSSRLNVPGQAVVFSPVNRGDGQDGNRALFREYHYVDTTGIIQTIGGLIGIEPHGGTESRRYVRMTSTAPLWFGQGDFLGFSFGFYRTDANRKKMWMTVKRYQRETTNTEPSLIVNQIAVSQATYTSDEIILSDSLLAAYDTASGGGGLRCDVYLKVWA